MTHLTATEEQLPDPDADARPAPTTETESTTPPPPQSPTYQENEDEDVVPNTATERYLADVLSDLGNQLNCFDGSSKSLPRGVTMNTGTAKAPEGAAEFGVYWFGVAMHAAHHVTQLHKPIDPLEQNRDFLFTVLSVRERFATGLRDRVMPEMLAVPPQGYSIYKRPSPLLPQMQRLAAESMTRHLVGHPVHLASGVAEDSDVVTNADDLQAIMLFDFGFWVSSFYPFFQHVSRLGLSSVVFLWETPLPPNVRAIGDALHYATISVNLQTNDEGEERGVLVPRTWLEELLNWLGAALGNDPLGELPLVPPPIPTNDCVCMAEDSLTKQWLLPEARDAVEVIPEKLFNILWLYFGGGAKYALYGKFPSRERLAQVTRPPVVRIEVEMTYDDTSMGAVVKSSVHTELSDVHVCSTLADVLREAVGGLEPDTFEKGVQRVWQVASYGEGFAAAEVKHLDSFFPSEVGWLLPLGALVSTRVSEAIAYTRASIAESPNKWKDYGVADEGLALRFTLVPDEELRKMDYYTLEEAMARSGVCGLTNVGNTCFMNSALQCLSNFQPFREHLIAENLTRYGNAAVALAFQQLLCNVWSGQYNSTDTRALKDLIGQRVKRYAGFQQQDASEFVEALLDLIAEEMNSVSGRRYLERRDEDNEMPAQEVSQRFWASYLENNTSFIAKDFFAQTKTHFQCQTCGKESCAFDTSLLQTVAIPSPTRKKEFTVTIAVRVAVSDDPARILHTELQIRVPVNDIDVPKEAELTRQIGVALLRNRKLHETVLRDYSRPVEDADDDLAPVRYDEISIMRIPDRDIVHAYAVARLDTEPRPLKDAPIYRAWYFLKDNNDLTLSNLVGAHDVYGSENEEAGSAPLSEDITAYAHKIAAASLVRKPPQLAYNYADASAATDYMGCPQVLPSNETEEDDAGATPAVRLLHYVSLMVVPANIADKIASTGDGWLETTRNGNSSVDASVVGTTSIIVFINFDRQKYTMHPMRDASGEEMQSSSHSLGWGSFPFGRRATTKATSDSDEDGDGFTLEDCLQQAMKPDVLKGDDSWFCPQCKELREAAIRTSFFRLPPCLVISLNRFKVNSSAYANKNNTVIRFPADLDYAPYVDPDARELYDNSNTQYRLRSVIYHGGSLSFGHYTATAYNDYLRQWVHYNDSSTSLEGTELPSALNAYVLCYERVPVRAVEPDSGEAGGST